MMLWGEATGNTMVRDTGVFLYNSERTAVEETPMLSCITGFIHSTDSA
jgi:hypothetical protein